MASPSSVSLENMHKVLKDQKKAKEMLLNDYEICISIYNLCESGLLYSRNIRETLDKVESNLKTLHDKYRIDILCEYDTLLKSYYDNHRILINDVKGLIAEFDTK